MKQLEKKNRACLCGIEFFKGDAEACLALLEGRMKEGKQTLLYTPNPIMLENAMRHADFHVALERADINLPDGIGVCMAAKLLGQPIPRRLSGIDMAKCVLMLAREKSYRVFLFGGQPGVANQAAERLVASLPQLEICGVRDGFFEETETDEILRAICASRADVLFVCLGSPKQELWIDKNHDRLPNVRLFMALGGTLDVFAGRVKRAPRFMQKAGLEWLFRMLNEPRRFRDVPKLISFSGRILAKAPKKLVIMHREKSQKKTF